MEDRFLEVFRELVGIRRVARLRYSLVLSEVIGQWLGSGWYHGWDAGFSYVLCLMVQMVWQGFVNQIVGLDVMVV